MGFFIDFFNTIFPELLNFANTFTSFLTRPMGTMFYDLNVLVNTVMGSNVVLLPVKTVLNAVLNLLSTAFMNVNIMHFILANFTGLLVLRFVRNLVG